MTAIKKVGEVLILTPQEFINFYENNISEIGDSVILPPEIGKPGFGNIFLDRRSSRIGYDQAFNKPEEGKQCQSEKIPGSN